MTDSAKKLFFIVMVAAAAVVFYGVVRFLTEDDPARIRRSVYAAVLGLEKKDPGRYGAVISASYQDTDGRNKLLLLAMLKDVLKDFEPVKCEIKQLTVESKGEAAAEAVIGFKFYMKDFKDRKLYYVAGRIRADFIKEGRVWRIRSTDYIDAKEIYSIQSVA
jgi:hypothetical protein